MHICARILAGLIAATWCASASAEMGTAQIAGTGEGPALEGSVVLADTDEGLQVEVHVTGVTPGQHAIHIHEFGDCGDRGKAAGGHFNPDDVQHGFLPENGLESAHPGDMGNIEIGDDGTGELTVMLPGVSLSSDIYNVAGRAVVLHEKPDDFGQPTGNAGGRIGCGPILITGQ